MTSHYLLGGSSHGALFHPASTREQQALYRQAEEMSPRRHSICRTVDSRPACNSIQVRRLSPCGVWLLAARPTRPRHFIIYYFLPFLGKVCARPRGGRRRPPAFSHGSGPRPQPTQGGEEGSRAAGRCLDLEGPWGGFAASAPALEEHESRLPV